MARKIEVELVGDSRSLERAFSRSSRAAASFNRSMETSAKRVGGASSSLLLMAGPRGIGGVATKLGVVGLALGAAAAPAAAFTQAASNLNEQLNRSNVVFGQSADEIEAWSKTTADAFGLSQTAAVEAAGGFGAMLQTAGLAERQSAGMSQRLVQLAADMASFNNQDPSEMLDRLRSGLAGEAEPLRRFGVFLSEAAVKQEAVRVGLAKAGATLTEAQKVQARYSLILRQTTKQQGDFARTSDSLANSQRRIRATVANLAAQIGEKLLPAVSPLVDKLADWLSKTETQNRILRISEGVINTVTGAWHLMVDAIHAVEGTIETLQRWNQQVKIIALKTARAIVEPFTRIPDKIFGLGVPGVADLVAKARDASAALTTELGKAEVDLYNIGRDVGASYGRGAQDAFREFTEEKIARPKAAGLIPLERTAAAAAKAAEKAAKAAAPRLTAADRAQRRNEWWDAMIGRLEDRVQDIRSLRGQLVELGRIAKLIQQRMAKTRDVTRRLNLEDRLLDVLRRQRAIREQLDDLEKRRRPQRFRAVTPAELTAGLELTRRQRVKLLQRMAGVSATGRGPAGGGPAAFGMPLRRPVTVVNIHGDVVTPDSNKFLRDMQKTARRTRAQQRGVRPGVALGGA